MSTKILNPLLEPLKLGQSLLKNRIVMGPLTRSRAVPTNVPNSTMLEYYVQRARGGASLIISEGALITQQGTEWQNAPGIWSQEQIDGWKKITDAVHKEGTVMFCQLWHVGRLSHPDAPEQKASGKPVYGPSAISARGFAGKFRFLPGKPGYVTFALSVTRKYQPTAIEDPKVLIELFRQGAINAKAAGFDGVELHGGHGYLIHEFLDSTSNKRTDSYGGSIENRARFGLEALTAAVDIWGPGKVSIKLTPTGGNDLGHVSIFSNVQIEEADLPSIKNAALFLSGGLSPEEGASLVASGDIDAAVFARAWICQPDVANRIIHGIPLETNIDMENLYPRLDKYATLEEAINKGYTDYPAARYIE
ncbi:hypothetical protein HWV62_13807 [Athelia sp. TMB]|nr:hypothetical protein HWV62_13807 [Athelia sp. TMB]